MIVGGTPLRQIGRLFGMSEASVRRHADKHISKALWSAADGQREADELQLVGDLRNQVAQIRDKATALLRQAETSGDTRTALAACREALRAVELLGRFAGDLDDAPQATCVVILPSNNRGDEFQIDYDGARDA